MGVLGYEDCLTWNNYDDLARLVLLHECFH